MKSFIATSQVWHGGGNQECFLPILRVGSLEQRVNVVPRDWKKRRIMVIHVLAGYRD
jgi:hypothetical protein